MTYSEFCKTKMELDDYIEYHKSGYQQWQENIEKGEDPVRCEAMANEHLKMYRWLTEYKEMKLDKTVTTDPALEKAKCVLAMEYLARQVNDEELFNFWLTMGVADGDIKYGDFSTNQVDPYYIEFDNFRELMDTFLDLMAAARKDGGLYCGNVTSDRG